MRVEADALAWWDVFDGAIDLAFKKDEPPRIAWDIEVALGHARLPLPDCIEDTFLAWLTGTVMRSFNRAYPLHIAIDPAGASSSEREEQDGEAAGGEACSAPAPAAVELPPISEAEQRAYDGLFSSAAKGCATVSRAAAAPVFASASVGEGDVDHIWGLCVSARGSDTAASRSEDELSSAEFAAALHLAAANVRGLLPGGLPPTMPGSLALYVFEAEEAAEAVGDSPGTGGTAGWPDLTPEEATEAIEQALEAGEAVPEWLFALAQPRETAAESRPAATVPPLNLQGGSAPARPTAGAAGGAKTTKDEKKAAALQLRQQKEDEKARAAQEKARVRKEKLEEKAAAAEAKRAAKAARDGSTQPVWQ